MQEEYPADISTVFAFVWANKNFPQASREILDNLEYLHLRSNKYIDFFFPGYRPIDITCTKFNISLDWEFISGDFVSAIDRIERISKWRYSGNSEILILEWSHRAIQFEHAISLDLDYLVKSEIIESPSSLLEDIIRIAKSCNRVSEFSTELNLLEAKHSVLKAITQYLSKKLQGAHAGSFKCRNLEIR